MNHYRDPQLRSLTRADTLERAAGAVIAGALMLFGCFGAGAVIGLFLWLGWETIKIVIG